MNRKRSAQNDDLECIPPLKKQKHQTVWRNNVKNLMETTDLCDVTFRVSLVNESKVSGNSYTQETDSSLSTDESESFQEFSCHRFPFATQSKVLKALIYDNVKSSDVNTTINLSGLTPTIFIIVRDHCYGLECNITINNVFDTLRAGDKFIIESLTTKCIDFIKNEWIIDKKALFEFLHCVSNYEQSSNDDLVLRYLPQIVNQNKVLQRYACEIRDCMKTETMSPSVLKHLVQSDSFYLAEDAIWDICLKYCLSYFRTCELCKTKFHVNDVLACHACKSYQIYACESKLTICHDCNVKLQQNVKQHYVEKNFDDVCWECKQDWKEKLVVIDHEDVLCARCSDDPVDQMHEETVSVVTAVLLVSV